MEKKINREIKIVIPIFAVIVLIALGFGVIMPEKVPVSFDIAGTATEWLQKSEAGTNQTILQELTRYHIPVLELIVYVLLTFIQFHFFKKQDELSEFIFHSKLAIIVLFGTLIPLSTYFYAMAYIPSIWYIVGPGVSFLLIYLFVVALITGLFNTTMKSRAKKGALPAKARKKKKK
jgi:MFS family permease